MNDPPRRPAPATLAAGIALAGLVLGGCVIPETTEFHIRTDSTHVARASITFRHLESDAGTPAGRRADFAKLVKDATGDEMLVEAARGKVYLHDRRLYLENGVLCASYEALCRDELRLDTTALSPVQVPAPTHAWITAAGESAAAPPPPPFDSTRIALRYRVSRGDSVVATNAAAEVGPDGSVALVWPDSIGDKWATVRARQFACRPAFAAFYREWSRGRNAHTASGRDRGRGSGGKSP